jgi:hypothetical protein
MTVRTNAWPACLWVTPGVCDCCKRLTPRHVQGLNDALPSAQLVDMYPPSKAIYHFYPRGPDRSRTFPLNKEMNYFDKKYGDGCVWLPGPVYDMLSSTRGGRLPVLCLGPCLYSTHSVPCTFIS